MTRASLEPIVTTEWLAQNLDDPDLRILDATVLLSPPSEVGGSWTVRSNREAHDVAHIPGSQHADLITDFSAPKGRFPRPDVALFTSSLGRLGIGQDHRIVIYDRSSGNWAARLWWVMRSFGLDQAAILDGGFSLWVAEGRPTTSELVTRKFTLPFVPQDRPELFTDRYEVLGIVERGGAHLINALDASDFHATETTGYARPGRIPGSLSIPASSLIDPVSGRFLPLPVLRQRFAEVLSRSGRNVVYCGGGVAACVDALVLTLLGEQDVAVYDASLEEWAADPTLPMEVEMRPRSVEGATDQ